MSFAELDLDFIERESHRSREDRAHGPSRVFLDLALLRDQELFGAARLGLPAGGSPLILLPHLPDELAETVEPLSQDTFVLSPQNFELASNLRESPALADDAVSPELRIESEALRTAVDEERMIHAPKGLQQAAVPFAPAAELPGTTKGPTPRRRSPTFHQAIRNIFSALQGNILIGLDLGSRSLKYVALRKTASGYQLKDYDYIELPRSEILPDGGMSDHEKERILNQHVREFLAGKSVRNGRIASAVSGLDVLVRHHLLPRMAKKDVASAMPWVTRKDLPFPVEAALIDHTVLGTRQHGNVEKMEVVAVAAPAAVVERHLALLRSSKVTPHKISTVAIALWNLLLRDRASQTQNVLIVDIGAVSTNMAFVDHGRLLFVREINTAGDDFTEALTGAAYAAAGEPARPGIALSHRAAERLKREYGLPGPSGPLAGQGHPTRSWAVLGQGLPAGDTPGTTASGIPLAEMAVMMRPVMERLANEIQRSMDYYREKFKAGPLHRIYLTGGGSRLKNLDRVLSAELGVTAERFDAFFSLGMDQGLEPARRAEETLAEVAPHLCVAIGLALDRRPAPNLLPPKLRDAARRRTVLRYLRYVAAFATLATVGITAVLSLQSRRFGADLQRLRLDHDRLLSRQQLYVELSHQLESVRTQLSAYQSRVAIRMTAAAHLRALSNLIPPSIALTAVNLETVTDGTHQDFHTQGPERAGDDAPPAEILTLDGVVLKAPAAAVSGTKQGVKLADFLISLEQSRYFRSIDLRRQEVHPDGTISFTLACFY